VIEKPIVYRPRSLAVGWMIMAAFVAAPVVLFFVTGSWILVVVVALVVCPFGLAITLGMSSSSMKLTDAGVHLRTNDENVVLPWDDIDHFDCVDTVVIHMKSGAIHHVTWMETAPAQRMLGTLGYGDYRAQELNSILVDQTGGTPEDGDIERVRPKIAADTPAGRARLAKAAFGTFAAGVLTVAIAGRVWWATLVTIAAVGTAWLLVRQRQRERGR